MIEAPNLKGLAGIVHGFGLRDSTHPPRLTTVFQIHSATVIDAEGRVGERICEGDALITKDRGLTVGVKTADCVPILMADPVTHAVAAIHAGWRGTAAGIVARTVERLTAQWNVLPGNIRAAIGPSIGGCCYEVGPEVAGHFGHQGNHHVRIDLQAINEAQLRAAGVEDVWKSGECTFCAAERFFSFRREKEQAGRMMSFIGLTDRHP